jgi:hypothetical protein
MITLQQTNMSTEYVQMPTDSDEKAGGIELQEPPPNVQVLTEDQINEIRADHSQETQRQFNEAVVRYVVHHNAEHQPRTTSGFTWIAIAVGIFLAFWFLTSGYQKTLL